MSTSAPLMLAEYEVLQGELTTRFETQTQRGYEGEPDVGHCNALTVRVRNRQRLQGEWVFEEAHPQVCRHATKVANILFRSPSIFRTLLHRR
jgi:hypothetical protein